MKLEERVKKIEERNKRVELDKSWETSWTRKTLIMILTYIIVIIYSYLIRKYDNILLNCKLTGNCPSEPRGKLIKKTCQTWLNGFRYFLYILESKGETVYGKTS